MAKIMSILTGKQDSRAPRPAPAAAPVVESDQGKAMQTSVEVLGQQIKRLSEDLTTARAETDAERAAHASTRERVASETAGRIRAEGELAAERAVSAGLRAQLDTERQAREALKAPLAQAIAAAAKDPVVVQPLAPGKAPTYKIVVTGTDINDRMRELTVTPVEKS